MHQAHSESHEVCTNMMNLKLQKLRFTDFLTSDYTTKLQQSKQYDTSTKTERQIYGTG